LSKTDEICMAAARCPGVCAMAHKKVDTFDKKHIIPPVLWVVLIARK
jgi:hypothetical protein